jgi:hypothetical protein
MDGSDTTITVTVSYAEDQLEFIIENHKGMYPIEKLEELNAQLMTYDCHGYKVLSHTISTVDMCQEPEPERWASLSAFLEQAKKNKYKEQCK